MPEKLPQNPAEEKHVISGIPKEWDENSLWPDGDHPKDPRKMTAEERKVEESRWDELTARYYDNATSEEYKIRIVKRSGRASWCFRKAAKVLTDAACGRGCSEEIRRTGNNALYDALHPYILERVRLYAPTYINTGDKEKNRNNFETMESEIFRWILTGLPHYDPDKSALSTYFNPHIRKGISLIANQSVRDAKRGVSEDIMKVMAKKNQVDMEKPGLHGADLLREIHVKLADSMTVEKIMNVLEAQKLSEDHAALDDPEGLDAVSRIPGPEESAIEEENKQNFYEAIRGLPEMEKKVICLSFGIDPVTEEETEKTMIPAQVSRKLGISADSVNAYLVKARKQLRDALSDMGWEGFQLSDDAEIPFLDNGPQEEWGMLESLVYTEVYTENSASLENVNKTEEIIEIPSILPPALP